jgi:lipoprotein-anchoring transpeptidase ErfK/SrfK
MKPVLLGIALTLSVSLLFPPVATAASLALTGPASSEIVEATTVPITWDSDGIQSVSLIAYGTRTPLGRKARGTFTEVIGQAIPADQGTQQWTVPWLDSIHFTIKAKGYDSSGQLVAQNTRDYGFRPEVLARRPHDGLYLDLHRKSRQRLYVQKNGKITKAYFTTSSMNYLWMPPNRHPNRPHDHAGVFKVLSKSRDHYSKLFEVHMYWALRYHNGHFIHATSRNLYDDLGDPASHGCNRLTHYDARELYKNTPVGARVEVIGPDG